MFRFDPAAGQYRAEQSQAMTWMPRIVRDRCIDRLRRPDIEPGQRAAGRSDRSDRAEWQGDLSPRHGRAPNGST
ncbi:hypothetical protein ACOTJB_19210 [Achromobacter xylosoxidans]